ncbi:MAG: helix-turn-helix transcriptional regulator [Eggerthellaceae bacterium]|nr:helix-turn-helix transcriptional regulator [Eggerthellaceae bacterium]
MSEKDAVSGHLFSNEFHGTTIHSFFNSRVFGFASTRAWVYLMFLGANVSSITWNGEQLPGICFIISTLTLSITLFVSAVFPLTLKNLLEKRSRQILATIVYSLGTLCLATSVLFGMFGLVIGIIGAVATGLTSGFFDLGYGEIYRNCKPQKTNIEVPFAFLHAALFYAVVLFIPSVARCIICALLPMSSSYCLFGRLKAFSSERSSHVQPIEFSTGKFTFKIGICACLVGISDSIVRAVFIQTSGYTLENFYQWPLVWGALITIIIIYGSLLFSHGGSIRSIYRSVIFIMAFFFMLLPVFTGSSLTESILALAGYGTFNALIWMLLAEISYNYRLSSITVFGIGWGMITVSVLLGSIAGSLIENFVILTPNALSLIALIATMFILISYMFVFKESDLIKLTMSDEENWEPEFTRWGLPDEENTDFGAVQEPEIITGKNISSSAKAPEAEASQHKPAREDKTQDPRPRFHDRCQEVAVTYGLSPKETEVMTLFAKGRSAARIQEELFISKGTVSTHLRHIYQKLDVHSKQEMLDLIDGIKHEE